MCVYVERGEGGEKKRKRKRRGESEAPPLGGGGFLNDGQETVVVPGNGMVSVRLSSHPKVPYLRKVRTGLMIGV